MLSVGFSRKGEADHAFDFECPRERWVHLAFTASDKKKRVALFADGDLAGWVDEFPTEGPAAEAKGLLDACL